ncbi:hypothetical protein BBJ28_00017854 [Nothophytophthora sp. Chile5]|nr:hypothetical protein BBJ28_00017854 [Nothophytophthora sp. Chile5]
MRREVRIALVVLAQLACFWFFLLHAPSHEGGLMSDRLPQSPALRRHRCLPIAHRDRRFVRPGVCVTADERLRTLEDLVYALKVLLENAQVAYWLDSGSLLGQYRAQELIPWDYNADFGVTMRGLEHLRASESDDVEVPEGYELAVFNSSRFKAGDCSKAVPARFVDTKLGFYANIFAFQESKGLFKDIVRPAAAGAVEEEVGDGVVVETLLGPEPSELWHRCVHCPEVEEEGENPSRRPRNASQVKKHFQIPKDWVFPLRPCKLEVFEVMCPAQSVPYLMYIFGNRFLTPELWE